MPCGLSFLDPPDMARVVTGLVLRMPVNGCGLQGILVTVAGKEWTNARDYAATIDNNTGLLITNISQAWKRGKYTARWTSG